MRLLGDFGDADDVIAGLPAMAVLKQTMNL